MRIFSNVVAIILLAGVLAPAFAQVNPDLPALPPESGNDAPIANANVTLPSAAPVLAKTPKVETVEQPVVTQTTTAVTTNAVPINQVQEVFPSAGANVVTISNPQPQPVLQVKENYIPSYGDFPQSLLFNATDIDRMKKVLVAYESVKRINIPIVAALEVEIPVVTIKEPQQYPSFYLSSVLYRSPKDWLLWMNNNKYSPKKRPSEVTLLSISPRSVVFSWKPEYIQQAKMRFEQKLVDKTIPKHFKSAMSKVHYDKNREAFIFTLAPNQSFVGAALGVYEGKYASRNVPTIVPQDQANEILNSANIAPDPIVGLDPDAKLKATVQDLNRIRSNLVQLAPRNNPNRPAAPAINQSVVAVPSGADGAEINLPPATLAPTVITLDPPSPPAVN